MNSPIKSISLDSNDDSDDDDDESDLEVIEEHFEDDFEDTMESKKNALPPKDKEEKQVVTEKWQKPATESFTTDMDKNSFSKCYNGEVAKEKWVNCVDNCLSPSQAALARVLTRSLNRSRDRSLHRL